MSDVMIFHDAKGGIFELINGTEHVSWVYDGEPQTVTIQAAYHTLADERGSVEANQVVLTADAGTQGFLDRVERISLDCYAPGEQAMNILNSVLGLVVGAGIETESGIYLDRVEVDQTPHELPYPSETMNHAMCRLLVTVRAV